MHRTKKLSQKLFLHQAKSFQLVILHQNLFRSLSVEKDRYRLVEWFDLLSKWQLRNILSSERTSLTWSWERFFNDFWNQWQQRDRPVIRKVCSFAFLENMFEFCNCSSIRKYSMRIKRLQILLIDSARISAPSFGNLPVNLSKLTAFEISIFFNILNLFSSKVLWKCETPQGLQNLSGKETQILGYNYLEGLVV